MFRKNPFIMMIALIVSFTLYPVLLTALDSSDQAGNSGAILADRHQVSVTPGYITKPVNRYQIDNSLLYVTSTPTPTPTFIADTPTPTVTPTPTPTFIADTPTPVVTPTPTPTVITDTPTPVVTPTPLDTPTPTANPTATPTGTPLPTIDPSPTVTVTPVITVTPTNTVYPTLTPTPSPSVPPQCRYIEKYDWSLFDVDSEETVYFDGKALNFFDENPESVWHTEWNVTYPYFPHYIVIDLGRRHYVNGFRYIPANMTGMIRDYNFYVTNDPDTAGWGEPVYSGSFTIDYEPEVMVFPWKQGRYVVLESLSSLDNSPWTSGAELDVFEEFISFTSTPSPTMTPTSTPNATSTVIPTPTMTPMPTATPGVYNIARGKAIFASSCYDAMYGPEMANDGTTNTMWAADIDSKPQWIYIDLAKTEPVLGLKLIWYNNYYASYYEVYTSRDAENWSLAMKYNKKSEGDDKFMIDYPANVRYLGIYCKAKSPTGSTYALREVEIYKRK